MKSSPPPPSYTVAMEQQNQFPPDVDVSENVEPPSYQEEISNATDDDIQQIQNDTTPAPAQEQRQQNALRDS